MDFAFAQQILQESRELSALPQTMSEILRLARDERSSAGEMAEVIMRDPTLTTDVLRIVNSPFFGAPRQVGSVTQAVMAIGIRETTAVALSASVYRMTADWQSSLQRKRFWRHSLEVAVAARMIAEHLRYPHAEETFVAGLLHDFGMLALEKAFPVQAGNIWQQAAREGQVIELEQSEWGADHAMVGQFLLGQWYLPETICSAVGTHHSMELPPVDSPGVMPSLIVRLAHRIGKFAVWSESRPSAEALLYKEQLRSHLRIPVEALILIEKNLFSRILVEAEYLDMDVGTADEIMLETHQLLFEQYITVEHLMDEIESLQQLVATAKAAQTN
jgi:HD-like signal output (HDOD) protein